jgi:hypothetical protein
LQEGWSIGAMEYWSIGVLEYWSIGVLEYWSGGVVEWWRIPEESGLRGKILREMLGSQGRLFALSAAIGSRQKMADARIRILFG